jgi:hypothetical protein
MSAPRTRRQITRDTGGTPPRSIDMSKDALRFVNDTKLPSNEALAELLRNVCGSKNGVGARTIRAATADNTASAQVNAGSLTSFTQNLSGQNKNDVKNSTLFAQLAANVAYDRTKDPINWYKNYVEVLGQIGWNQPAFAFDTYSSGGSTVQMDEAVLGILARIATGDELAMVAATMEGLKSLGSDTKQMKIWDASACNGSNGNFQIFPVDRVPNGDVVMVLTGMQFNATTSHGRFLWWSWSSTSINIQRAADKFVLNESVYETVRAAIVQKLGERAVQLVADIDIG